MPPPEFMTTERYAEVACRSEGRFGRGKKVEDLVSFPGFSSDCLPVYAASACRAVGPATNGEVPAAVRG